MSIQETFEELGQMLEVEYLNNFESKLFQDLTWNEQKNLKEVWFSLNISRKNTREEKGKRK